MSLLLSLPPELLVNILSYLPRADIKACRAVSHAYCVLATPLIFQEIPFHFEPGGCTSLDHIARVPHLASHVRTIRLQRAKGMHRFDSYDAWEMATIYEHQPWEDLYGPSPPPPIDARLMLRGEWDALDAPARERLYDEYQQETQATDEYFARFASAVLAAASSQYSERPSPLPADTDAAHLVRCYGRASRLLRHVQTFLYAPAYRVDELRWGETWRGVAFHVFAFVDLGWGDEPYYDAIQLFAALAFSHFPSEPLALQSLTLTTQGGAFWTVPHLLRLLYWMRESPESRDSFEHSDYSRLEGALTVDGWEHTIEQVEHLTRTLVATEQRFLSLVRLECRVDTLNDGGGRRGDEDIVRGVARCIRKARDLEWLSVAFGEEVHGEHDPQYCFTTASRLDVARTATISRHLVGAVASLRHVRHLHLSFHTTAPHLMTALRVLPHLTSLRITHMALVVGTWDDVLVWFKNNLTLTQVGLLVLEDVVRDRPRILLDSRVPAWTCPTVSEGWYKDYEEDIRRYVLRKSLAPLILSPDEYVAKRSHPQCRDPLSQTMSIASA